MIKVLKNRVFDSLKTYMPGDTIPGLSPKEEKQLVEDGMAEYVGDVVDIGDIDGDSDDTNDNDDDLNEPVGDNDIDDNVEGDLPEDESINSTESSESFELNPDEYIVELSTKPTSRKGK